MALVIVLAGMLVASVIPDGPTGHPAYAQTADSSIEFAENGTGPVGTFYAYDQDGDAIVWSLSGPDADKFTIDGGVLAFREPPNYEDPQSRSGSDVYRVTVQAGGGTHDVAVTVTDVDEAGTASIDRRQPQVSRPLGAILSDEDDGVSGQRWQWARSEDKTTWTDIEGATSPRRSPAEADEGMYLRAKVTYSDKFGPGKTASAVSANPVEARTLSNAAPGFVGRRGDKVTTVTLRVSENTAVGRSVGRRVSATDADDDVLFYELLDTPDLEDIDDDARFTIDSATGQIRVGKELGADDGEREDEDSTALTGSPALPSSEDADDANNSEYVLRVRASDPSTASATVNVIVRVTNVNEPPAFIENVPTLLRVEENPEDQPVITIGESGTPINDTTFAVTDQDASDTRFTYSVTGDDEEVLAFDNSTNILGFKAGHEPDYEEKISYSITVVARSGGRSTTLDVTIEVVDTEDAGEVTLSQRQGQVDIDINAAVSDPDGGVSIRRWEWERTVDDDLAASTKCEDIDTDEDWTPIGGASSAAYTPTSADVGRCLRATAIYTDNIENPAVMPIHRG